VVDRPADGAELGPGGIVSGWAVSPAGVVAVSVALMGQEIGRASLGGERPDVAAIHPRAPGAARSGWLLSLAREAVAAIQGEAELLVVAEDGAGARTEVRRRVTISDADEGDEVRLLLVCEEPGDGGVLSTETVVRGWAAGQAAIEEVAVWLEDRLLGRVSRGRERPDVAADHPTWRQALESGFVFRLPAAPGPPLPREAALTLVARDETGRQVEVRRQVRLEAGPVGGSIDVPSVRAPANPLREAGWSSPLAVYGWAADELGVERIDVLLDDRPVAEAEYGLPREDVEYGNPRLRRLGIAARSGWQAVVHTDGVEPGLHRVSAVVHGGSGSFPLGPVPVWLRAESVRADAARQRRLLAILRCPDCGGEIEPGEAGPGCAACGRAIPTNAFGTLLFEETYVGLDWREAGLTSHPYPPEATAIVVAAADGLVLDVGAGLRENLPQVIQTDAVAFPTTDVSADAAKLPFADESFDGVIACNLLEHVADPTGVVREMRRVCKVGGRLYADCTSVHPYHGFPHHYFNATVTGLEWLMREAGGAAGSAKPTDNRIAVRLALETWLNSLEEPDARPAVEAMNVGELLALLNKPGQNPGLYHRLTKVFTDGRLLPAKVTFDGVRDR